MLNNPLRYTDPSGELTQAEFDAIVTDLWNSPNGGTWNSDNGLHHFSSGDEAFGYGVGFMNQHGAWGGGSGWASSPDHALSRYNGGRITPGMVEGFYQQQWAGQYYNISAGYAPSGNGFNISFTLGHIATDDNRAVSYTSYEKMAQLMGMNINKGFLANNWQDIAFLTNDLAQAVGNNSSLNVALRMDRPTTMIHLPPGITFPASTRAMNIVSKITTPIAKGAPWAAFGTIGYNVFLVGRLQLETLISQLLPVFRLFLVGAC